jgi:hypothetical protein
LTEREEAFYARPVESGGLEKTDWLRGVGLKAMAGENPYRPNGGDAVP